MVASPLQVPHAPKAAALDWRAILRHVARSRALDDLEEFTLFRDRKVLYQFSARGHDLWLHAKGRTGAHVVVPLDKGHTCPAEVLIDAAHLAAHFSDDPLLSCSTRKWCRWLNSRLRLNELDGRDSGNIASNAQRVARFGSTSNPLPMWAPAAITWGP